MKSAGFPRDDYTPYGYLDVPGHTKRLTPKGVLRSRDVGFRWHYPALGTSYGGRREVYQSSVRIGVDSALALYDFDEGTAPYHSKDLFRFEVRKGDATAEAEFYLVDDDVVCADVVVRSGQTLTVRADYARVVAADQGWGESGLIGRRTGDRVVLQSFEDGDAFVVEIVGNESTPRAVTIGSDVESAVFRNGDVTVLGDNGEQIDVSGTFTLAGKGKVRVLFGRGRTSDEAIERVAHAKRTAVAARAAKLATDQAYWERAPRLIGDWPAHWRRGMVYDAETVRMMVKPPVGIYRHVWDAMQIQAPRVVLGEAAFDALLLGYADPELAQELLLGTFVDAPLPQVPCSREDGSYNMVSADGSVCGTGPQWGYPWRVIELLYAMRPDDEWVAKLYPHLANYLDWWLENRRDADGWLVHACSWESGQDLSPRFGDQPLGGGHPTWHVRPVDLQAAFAHAASTMSTLAARLGRTPDVDRWERLDEEFSQRTQRLWNGERYADVDGTTGMSTETDDVMLLAPVALGLAAPERVELLAASTRYEPEHVVWPMFAWTAVDAATVAGKYDAAARLAGAVVDRAYGFWDARVYEPGRTMPGVASEYWPPSGRCGGEGYGWGAFTTHLVLGVLIGLRPGVDGLSIRPNLPADFRVTGRSYGLRITLRTREIDLTLAPVQDGVEVSLNRRTVTLGWGEQHRWTWSEVES